MLSYPWFLIEMGLTGIFLMEINKGMTIYLRRVMNVTAWVSGFPLAPACGQTKALNLCTKP